MATEMKILLICAAILGIAVFSWYADALSLDTPKPAEVDGVLITGICDVCGLIRPEAETARIRFCPGHPIEKDLLVEIVVVGEEVFTMCYEPQTNRIELTGAENSADAVRRMCFGLMEIAEPNEHLMSAILVYD